MKAEVNGIKVGVQLAVSFEMEAMTLDFDFRELEKLQETKLNNDFRMELLHAENKALETIRDEIDSRIADEIRDAFKNDAE